MGFGVLESRQAIVPGTIQLFDNVIDENATAHLKHTPDGKTILAPQPSDSPNDPLNWPTWKKDFVYVMCLLGGILSGVHGPITAPVTVLLADQFNTTIADIALLSSYMLLVIAGVGYIDSAIAHILGKRAIFLVSMLILVVSDAWASKAATYGSLMGARVLSGAGQAAFECITSSVIADLYFVHQRPRRVGAFILLFGTGVYLGVPISAQIIAISSWEMAFAGLAISEGIMFVVMFLFFEEPVYGREHIDPLANLSEQTILEKINDPTMDHHQDEKADANVDASQLERANTAAIEQRKTFVQRLKVYNGRFSHENFFTLLYRVLILTFHPTIFWVATSGLVLSWPVGISYTAAAFLTLPPYNFGFTDVANMYIGAWIGMVLGLLIGAPTFQWLAKYLARKNKNVYEPEFLLYQVIPGMAFCIVGFVGWGIGEANTISWAGLAVFFAFANGGAVMYNNSAINYIIDAHRNWANEASVVCFAAKNIFPFGMGYFFVPWWASAGPKTVWCVVAGIQTGLALFGILVYIYGKRMRAFWSQRRFLGVSQELKHHG